MLTRPAISTSSQSFTTDTAKYPLTQPVVKLDARKQTAGEAQFIADIPHMTGQLFAVFVKSTVASGEVESIDTSAALEMPGVVR